MVSHSTADAGWRPDRRSFLKSAGAAVVMVQVFGRWPGTTGVVTAGEIEVAAAAPPPWPLREMALHGPPRGSASNSLRRTDTVDGRTVTTWGGGGGRALSIATSSNSVEVHYLDPYWRASARQVSLVPLDQLDHELRSHFGERAWRDMRRLATA